ncbi:MAG: MBL fold metallo-hydrolase [Gammaproteobacteria bacterium]|nr:MBL fold metallo-hydrolase [Gammaproteobacteria bacterium]
MGLKGFLRIVYILFAVLTITVMVLWGYWRYGLFDTVELRNRVYLIQASLLGKPVGANVLAVDTAEGWVLVDSQLSGLATPLSIALEGLSDQRVRAIINTHWHPDHTGGNLDLGEGAHRYAHESTQLWMSSAQSARALTSPESVHNFPPSPIDAIPNITYKQDTTIAYGSIRLKLVHPGRAHTGGDTIVEIPHANIIHMGDILWPGALPFSEPEHGGDLLGLMDTLLRYSENADEATLFVSGHGDVLTAEELRAYVDAVRAAFIQVTTGFSNVDALRNAVELPEPLNSLQTPLVPAWRWAEMLEASQ